jgi:hypothetical protein
VGGAQTCSSIVTQVVGGRGEIVDTDGFDHRRQSDAGVPAAWVPRARRSRNLSEPAILVLMTALERGAER